MRGLTLVLGFVVAGCTTTRDRPDRYDAAYSFSAGRPVSQETAWHAACAAMAWEGVQVNAMKVVARPDPTGRTSIYVFADYGLRAKPTVEEREREANAVTMAFMRRFQQALDLSATGKPLPPEPPPLPSRG